MNNMMINVKREFWEYKKLILSVPIGLALIMFVAGILGLFVLSYQNGVAIQVDSDKPHTPEVTAQPLDFFSEAEPLTEDQKRQLDDRLARELSAGKYGEQLSGESYRSAEIQSWIDNSIQEVIGLFMAVAWAVAIYYLFGSLHADRKDKSIFFWKSLPVSETENVIAKLLFGSVGFVSVAVAVGWVAYIVFMIMGFGALSNVDVGVGKGELFGALSFVKLFVYPLVSVFVGVLWTAPVFAYIAFCSASSKRSPFLKFVVPILAIALVEVIVFRSGAFITWVGSHFPFAILSDIFSAGSLGEYFSQLINNKGADLLLGLIVAAALIFGAIWYRSNRFEI